VAGYFAAADRHRVLKLMTMIALLPAAAAAQTDQYWQQLNANRAAQCDTQIVQLLKTIDDLKKQLDEAKAENKK
jgi:hypothetical protein